MDSVSQFVLGASVAEVCVGKKLGNRALLWGGIAGTIPDLDVISNWWLDEFTAMTLHRGFSHSIIFCLIASPLFAWIWFRLTPDHKRKITFRGWVNMFAWCFGTHIALDCFTTWGTHVFWPINAPISTNSIFVADPIYTVPFIVLLITLMFFNRENTRRRKINATALFLSSAYLVIALVLKGFANTGFEESFKAQNMEVIDYKSRPTPLNSLLWTVNAEVKDGYYLGYYSVLDENTDVNYLYVPKNHEVLDPFREDEQVKKVIKMTQGWYTVTPTDSCILVNDLRFGQPMGWRSKPDEFVFQYRLYEKDDGSIVVGAPRPPRPKNDEERAEAYDMLSAIFNRALGKKD